MRTPGNNTGTVTAQVYMTCSVARFGPSLFGSDVPLVNPGSIGPYLLNVRVDVGARRLARQHVPARRRSGDLDALARENGSSDPPQPHGETGGGPLTGRAKGTWRIRPSPAMTPLPGSHDASARVSVPYRLGGNLAIRTGVTIVLLSLVSPPTATERTPGPTFEAEHRTPHLNGRPPAVPCAEGGPVAPRRAVTAWGVATSPRQALR
jgi:hypothetical protein